MRTSHPTALHPRKRTTQPSGKGELSRDLRLWKFAACAFAYQLCNAALFPFAITAVDSQAGSDTPLYVSAALVASQAVAALLSPLIGRQAQQRGRRLVLIVGFLMLPARAVLYAVLMTPITLVGFNVLDGVSSAIFGVLVPLVVADLTQRGGRFNLALSIVGFVMTIGASLSTLAAGFVAQRFGLTATFLSLALAGAGGVLLVATLLAETSHLSRRASGRALETTQHAS